MVSDDRNSSMLEKIHFIIENYKENFERINEEERYKWEAIGWYKKHWNIKADDFAAMLEKAFGKTYNLLSSGMYFARKVIVEFAQDHPEDVRALFVMLYDETLSLDERYTAFRKKAEERLKELQKTDSKVKKHDQDLRAIMLYLTFEYPEKYYLFKSTMFDSFSDRVGYVKKQPKQKSAVWKAECFMQLCDLVLGEVKKDKELIEMSKARLDGACYQDEALHLLTMDIIYYGSNYMIDEEKRGWILLWNPDNWAWDDFEDWCERTKNGETFEIAWSCSSKQPKIGDEVFLMKNGFWPRGIIAHGKVTKEPYEALHYNLTKAAEGKTSNHIDVEFDRIQNYEIDENFLNQNFLAAKYPQQTWSSRASGIEIKNEVLSSLLEEWNNIIKPELEDYWPTLEEYDPKITKEQWTELLKDEEVTLYENLRMFKMMLELGGESTCANLAECYGGSAGSYNGYGRGFGERVHKKTNCPLCDDGNRKRRYTIPFVGKVVSENGKNRYLWRLRSELKGALEEMDLSGIDIALSKKKTIEYEKNMILYGPPGTGKTYNTAIYAVAICDGEDIEEVKEWEYQEVLERYKALMSEGRVAFTTFHQSYGYEEFIEGIKPQTKPDNKDVFYEVIPGIFKEFCEKAESVEVKADTFEVAKDAVVWKATIRNEVAQDCYDNNRVRIDWGMESEGAAGFVQDMKKGDIVIVNDGSRSIINGIAVIISDEAFSLGTQSDATTRNVQWLAKGLQEDICSINDGKMLHRMTCCRVPSMTVNDILALAVKKNNDLKNTKIEKNNEPHVFIIDEINRGNISKIFGELITLIEDSKRAGMKEEASAILPYSGKKFSVPQNVYIIGTMNTADRSIALMDTALRRRFSFMEMMPDAELLADIEIEGINIAKMLDTINKRISYLYDREHTIGHAFFMKLRDDATIEKLAEIFEKQIIPLLQEYFYEDYQKIQLVLGDNAKSDAAYKFIQEKETKVKEIFKGAASLDLDLPEYSFTINKEAFAEAQSYVEIYS